MRHLDAELSRAQRAEVDEHLARCWQCRARRAQLEEQINAVAGVFSGCEFSEAQVQRGLERLSRELPQAPRRAHVGFRAGIALLAAGFLAAGVRYLQHTEQSEFPAPRQAAVAAKPRPEAPVADVGAMALARRAPVVLIAPEPEPAPILEAAPRVAENRMPLLHVEVLYALHAAGADLGEPVTVTRTPQRIVVDGIVDTQARLRQLRTALEEIHAGELLEFRLTAAEEAPLLPPTQPALTLARVSASPAIQPLLEQQGMRFPVAMGQSAVRMATAALDHAWAIRRLDAALPAEDLDALPVAGRWLLKEIREDHEQRIAESLRSLRSLLAPVLALREASALPSFTPFERTVLVRDLVHSLFAGRQAPEGYVSADAMLGMLRALLTSE
ncbi:MAG: hypothetical protein JST93_33325 [Acidobacteria bacterium]|nr:hypothetical protein [Acidobacteriota bacterium]